VFPSHDSPANLLDPRPALAAFRPEAATGKKSPSTQESIVHGPGVSRRTQSKGARGWPPTTAGKFVSLRVPSGVPLAIGICNATPAPGGAANDLIVHPAAGNLGRRLPVAVLLALSPKSLRFISTGIFCGPHSREVRSHFWKQGEEF